MTIALPIKYKAVIIEDPNDLKHYMSVRSQCFYFIFTQHKLCLDMDEPQQDKIRITIPSMEEHEELMDWKNIGHCDMMVFHLLNHLHMRIKTYMETEFYIKSKIYTNFICDFIHIK